MKWSSLAKRARSVGQTAVSQSFSAASNFIIILALGRGGGETRVAEFVLAFVVYNTALGLQRALITDALLARPFKGESSLRGDARAVTTSLVLSGAAALISLVAGLASPFYQLVWLAPILPVLLLEDVCRYLLFRRDKPTAAAVIDGVWAATSCIGFFFIVSHPSYRWAIVFWGAGAFIATITGTVVAKLRLAAVRESLSWWRRELWGSSRWLTLESIGFYADQQITAFGFTAVAGKSLFGEWQITQSLLGIAAFLNTGLFIMTITHFSRRAGSLRSAAIVSLLSAATTLLLTALLLAVGPFVLPILYANKVHLDAGIILPTGITLALSAATAGPVSLIRAHRVEGVLPLARGLALIAVSPLAVVVARHDFSLALWVLADGALLYLAIVTRAVLRMDIDRLPPSHEVAEPVPELAH